MIPQGAVLIVDVSTHSRPKAAGIGSKLYEFQGVVSTHSRPKAAGYCARVKAKRVDGFNSQPPEGGWFARKTLKAHQQKFQLTAARRRLGLLIREELLLLPCFNSQPPEGGWPARYLLPLRVRSFNSQPPEGGWLVAIWLQTAGKKVSTHSRPKAAG